MMGAWGGLYETRIGPVAAPWYFRSVGRDARGFRGGSEGRCIDAGREPRERTCGASKPLLSTVLQR